MGRTSLAIIIALFGLIIGCSEKLLRGNYIIDNGVYNNIPRITIERVESPYVSVYDVET